MQHPETAADILRMESYEITDLDDGIVPQPTRVYMRSRGIQDLFPNHAFEDTPGLPLVLSYNFYLFARCTK